MLKGWGMSGFGEGCTAEMAWNSLGHGFVKGMHCPSPVRIGDTELYSTSKARMNDSEQVGKGMLKLP